MPDSAHPSGCAKSGILLAIDLGSTNFKAALFDDALERLGGHSVPAPYLRNDGDRIEMDADEVRQAASDLIVETCRKTGIGADAVTSVAVTSQAQNFTFLDAEGRARAPVISWQDFRSQAEAEELSAAFGRDWESSKQVWSSKEGYPGDVDYREYYRDIGHELDYEYIKPYIHPQGIRINTGIKYWRITGNTDYKEAYVPDWAREKAAMHAGNFMFNREKQVEHLEPHMDRKPIIISPYDAELFGHWWFEGPMWIDFLARKICYDQKAVKMITPSEYLTEYPTNQVAVPSASSWGWKGYSEFWLEGGNDWVYRHLHKAGQKMAELADRFGADITAGRKDNLKLRALNQAARELVLAQSSDWPFIMKTGTMVAYAQKRIKVHITRFDRIYNDLVNNTIDKEWLSEIESRDNIFRNMDCASYYLGPRPRKKTAVNVKVKKKSSRKALR